MEFIHEYSLLFVVALPVAIVAGINLVLGLTGESGTLLLPSLRGYPAIEVPRVEATPEAAAVDPVAAGDPAGHDEYRKAA